MKLECSPQIVGRGGGHSDIKFSENPSSSMRADGHDEANSRFSQFCINAKKLNQHVMSEQASLPML